MRDGLIESSLDSKMIRSFLLVALVLVAFGVNEIVSNETMRSITRGFLKVLDDCKAEVCFISFYFLIFISVSFGLIICTDASCNIISVVSKSFS